jgi:hypothetical protein
MPDILMITAIAGAENCAALLSRQFQLSVETAVSRKEAVAALKRREYLLAVIDESMIEPDEDGGDALFKYMGAAIPLEINFAISGCGRLVRAVRAALSRRERERAVAARAAASAMQNELREKVAGLLLHSELALAEPGLAPSLASKLRIIVELAGNLREGLGSSTAQTPASAAATSLRIQGVSTGLAGHAVLPGTPVPGMRRREHLSSSLPAIAAENRPNGVGAGQAPLRPAL